MGFNYWTFVLVDWSIDNFNLKKTISYGRQVLHVHDYDRAGLELQQQDLEKFLPKPGGPKRVYADEAYASAKNIELDSLDYSPYEGAKLIADLRNPPEYNSDLLQYQNYYDAVFDIGTTEHVGNPFTSLQNAFALLKPGVYYFYDLPYLGWEDHGFIQFNPGFFADFCRENNYSLRFQLIHQTCRGENLIFCRNSTGVKVPNIILSLFGCIQKPVDSGNIVKAASQSLNKKSFEDVKNSLLQSDDILSLNSPVINAIKPDDFYAYMNSTKQLPLLYISSESNKFEFVANKNIFNPSLVQ